MKKLLLSVAAASAVVFAFACDLEKTSNQLQANKVMVATILSTPPVTVSPLALAGVDANYFGFDGGFPVYDGGGFDAGAYDGGFGFNENGLTFPGQTATFVFFGQRQTQTLDAPPEGIAGAVVTVQPGLTGSATTLKEEGPAGSHSRTSADDANFKYVSGADYYFNATHQGEKYTGKVEKVPTLENIPEFHPSKGYIEMAAGSAFVFTRPEPPEGETRNFGFVTVYPIKENGEKGEPTYSNVPKAPLDFLKLIAAPSEWRGSPVTIPGTAFPQSKHTYLIIFQSVKKGDPETDNLFTGSAILAGTAEVGVVKTQ